MSEASNLVDELKQTFGVRHVKDFGACIVIPKGKFNIEWEKPLQEAGVTIKHNVDLPGGEGCTVLLLKPEHLSEQRLVYEPPNRSPWTEEEEERLWKRMQELEVNGICGIEERLAKIVAEFPGRTLNALRLKFHQLKKKYVEFSKAAQKTPQTSIVETLPTEKSTKFAREGTAQQELQEILKILQQIMEILHKITVELSMKGLEIKELKGEIKIPDSLWIAYADALLEDDPQFRQVFREKTKKLLEVAK